MKKLISVLYFAFSGGCATGTATTTATPPRPPADVVAEAKNGLSDTNVATQQEPEKTKPKALWGVCDTDISRPLDCTDVERYIRKHEKASYIGKTCYLDEPPTSSIRVGPNCRYSITHRLTLAEFSSYAEGTKTPTDLLEEHQLYMPSMDVWLTLRLYLNEGDEIWTATSSNCGLFWGFFVVRDKRPLCFVFTEHMM